MRDLRRKLAAVDGKCKCNTATLQDGLRFETHLTEEARCRVEKLELRGNEAIETRKRSISVKKLELRGRRAVRKIYELGLWKPVIDHEGEKSMKIGFFTLFSPLNRCV